jgi:hypothetical protein
MRALCSARTGSFEARALAPRSPGGCGGWLHASAARPSRCRFSSEEFVANRNTVLHLQIPGTDKSVYLVGTAHISKKSAEEVLHIFTMLYAYSSSALGEGGHRQGQPGLHPRMPCPLVLSVEFV